MGRPGRATYEDLLRLPEQVVGEIVAGVLHASPRPSAAHAHTALSLGSDVSGPFGRGRGGPGGWWILVEPELHLGEDVLVPDLAGWRRERLPSLQGIVAFELAPDWVCEVTSPRTAKLDRGAKMKVYASSGIPNLWLVHPIDQTLEIYRLLGGAYVTVETYGGADRVRAEPFDAVELDLTGWWSEPPLAP